MNTEKTFIQRLSDIRSLQNPNSDDLLFLIDLLSNPAENEMLQTAAVSALQKSGLEASNRLYEKYLFVLLNKCVLSNKCESESYSVSSSESAIKTLIKLSYALSQIIETPDSVFLELLKSGIPRVRQNAVIGLSQKNNSDLASVFLFVLQNDSDPETAFEAAAALEKRGPDSLKFFEIVMEDDAKHNPYIDSEMKLNTSEKLTRIDNHVIAKVIEISGEFGDDGTINYLSPYLSRQDERIAETAKNAIQKIKSKNSDRDDKKNQ